MPFQKNNEFRATPLNEEPFDKSPVCLKVSKGVKDKLKAVPDWQERLREFIDKLIAQSLDIRQ